MIDQNLGRGSVLLLSLWATATLATLGIVQATRLSLEVQWVGRLQEQRQAWYFGWTGVETARALLASDAVASFDVMKENWGQVPKEPLAFGGGTFQYQIFDEQSKVPLNVVNRFPSGQDLLLRLNFPPQAATQLLARLNENPPKPLVHLAELRTFPDVTSEFLSHIEPEVTLHGDWPVNINTASVDVLQLLGFSPAGANQMTTYRNGADGLLGTSDDRSFEEEGKIIGDLENAQLILVNDDKVLLGNLISGGFIGVRSQFFKVEANGRTQRHGIRQKISAFLQRQTAGTSPLIGGWYETR